MKPKIMEFMMHAIIMSKYLLEYNKDFWNNRIQQHFKNPAFEILKHAQHINPQIGTMPFILPPF